MAGREGLWVYEIDGDRVRAVPGSWDGTSYVLEPGASVEI
jgi:hypothetical protein